MRRNLTLTIGLAGVALFALVAVLAPPLFAAQADELSAASREGASVAHPLGTDSLGRDVLLRTLVATRLTLLMAIGCTLLAAGAGTLVGAAVAVAGPRARAAGNRAIDLLIAFPAVITALIVAAILGPSVRSAMLAVGIAFVPAFARLSSAVGAAIARQPFVAVARLLGHPSGTVMRRHVVPNMAGPLLVVTSVTFGSSVIALAGVSFLGLGVQDPQYDWGKMLAEGLGALYTNPVVAIGPAVAIVLLGLCAGLVADGLAADAERSNAAAPSDRAARGRAAQALSGSGTAARADGAAAVVRELRILRADGHPLVAGVSLRVEPQEIVGLVGESGSGKTLTAMALTGLGPASLELDAAELRVGDVDLLAVDERDERLGHAVGVVFQDTSTAFNPALRMRRQLAEAPRMRALPREAVTEELTRALHSVRVRGAALRLHQHPHELSGGIRQRLLIAMAMVNRPQLLIADEPTTALDVTTQASVLAALRTINRENGTAMLFISHDLAVVGEICHRVIVMRDGVVVEELDVEQLRAGDVTHPYTRALLDATPVLPDLHPPRPIEEAR